MISEKYRVWQLVQTRREDRAIQADMSVFKSALVTLNIPGGIYVQWPSLVTTTFVGYVPSNFSSALQTVFVSSVRSSYSHPDLLLITTPLFQITPVLNTGLSLSEPLQLYKGYNAI